MTSGRPSSELVRILKAFGYSWQGFKAACDQPAFRLEIIIALVFIPLALALAHTGVERALLIGSILLVIIVELLNTGIEAAIDRISDEWHELSARAKDIGSAAVFLSFVNAGVIWLLIFFLRRTWNSKGCKISRI